MISKKEFIKLYCDEFIYNATGVVAVLDEKVFERLDVDEAKTIRDLSDYGYPAEVERFGRDKIVTWDVDNMGSSSYSDQDRKKEDDFMDALKREIENLTSTLGQRRSLPKKEFDPDKFDWGGEDSIK